MTALPRLGAVILAALAAVLLSGCELLPLAGVGSEVPAAAPEETPVDQISGGDRFPDVLDARLDPTGDGTFDVIVTLSSPYDTPSRYADGWRVTDTEGNVLGTHTLLHDHASEQPFTRTQRGLRIPEGVTEVTVQGRDQVNGFGGIARTVVVPDEQP